MSPAVAVIDIGSNSIKVLVAARAGRERVHALHSRTLDARISAGISKARPELAAAGMQRGLGAIRTLLGEAAAFSPARVILVATSAVRDAANGAEFRALVREATGHDIRILSGEDEARLIGLGLTCDPELGDLRDFYVFDLGGGSLECLAFRNRTLEQAQSLQLGCVRLTELLVPEPAEPLAEPTRVAIQEHVGRALRAGPFKFDLSSEAAVVGTGGTVATARAILAAQHGRTFEETDSYVALEQLQRLLHELSQKTLSQRQQVRGLPPARADIFPTALVTLIAVAEAAGATGLRNSLYNLRYGLAAEALDALA